MSAGAAFVRPARTIPDHPVAAAINLADADPILPATEHRNRPVANVEGATDRPPITDRESVVDAFWFLRPKPAPTVASDFNARPADIRGLRVRARRLGRLTWRDAMRGAATALWRLVQVAPWPGYMRDDST